MGTKNRPASAMVQFFANLFIFNGASKAPAKTGARRRVWAPGPAPVIPNKILLGIISHSEVRGSYQFIHVLQK
jgi:hypothetical protein